MVDVMTILETLANNINYAIIYALLVKCKTMTLKEIEEMTAYSEKEILGALDYLDSNGLSINVFDKGRLGEHLYAITAFGEKLEKIFNEMTS